MVAIKRTLWAGLAFVCLLGQGAAADAVGRVVALTQGATIETSDGTQTLVLDQDILNGDVIRTDVNGTVQMLFNDETKIALGPNSHLSIDNVFLEQNREPRFVVRSLGGVFRMISGRSPKSSYKLKTPTATMGVRGTVFDVAVDTARGTTRTVTFDGVVALCKFGCAPITGECSVARTNLIAGTRPPSSKRERDAILNSLFPFVLEQDALDQSFRARIETCGEIDRSVFLKPVNPSPAPQSGERETPTRSDRTRDKDDP